MSTTMTTKNQNQSGSQQLSRSSGAEQTYQQTFVPQFDIWEGDDEYILYGDLPGVEVDDLVIEFENLQLTVHGRVNPRQNANYTYAEYGVGDFHRIFTIGEAIDSEGIAAEVHDGVLTLHLPKSEEARPRRINVKAK